MHSHTCSDTSCYTCIWLELSRRLFDNVNSDTFVNPISIVDKLRDISNNTFNRGIQQDAHEFLVLLLVKFDVNITQIFQGQTKSTISCSNCPYQSISVETFMDILLPLSASTSTLYQGNLINITVLISTTSY
jgi:uncharacterized UBP type Zn finger protein